jgi:diguanylate cyclase (GGDEF)-like protein
MGRLLAAAHELKRLMSAQAVLPMTGVDRARHFRLAGRFRMVVVPVLATLLIWLLRDRSLPFLLLLALLTYPGAVVTAFTMRRREVFAPHVWLRDLMSMGFFAALAPPYIVPAMMCSLMILAFCSYTLERRATMVLAIASIISIFAAGLFAHDEVSWLSLGFYPLAVAGIVLPVTLMANTVHRWHGTNERIADALGMCLWECDDLPFAAHSMIYVYGNTERLLGLAPNARLTNSEWADLLHPDDAHINDVIDAAIAAGHDYRVRYRQVHVDGSIRWVEEVGHVELNAAGEPTRVSGLTHNIDSLIATGEQIDQLDATFDSLPLAIAILHLVDPADPTSLTLVHENAESKRINTGSPRDGRRLINLDPRLFDSGEDRGIGFVLAEVAAGGEPVTIPDTRLMIDGRIRLHSVRISPLPNHRVAVIVEDVQDVHDAREELERTAFVDPLTELPNRIRMRNEVASAPVGSLLAVLDLDRFTDINDSFGHACGDEMIAEVGRVLADAPDGVIVARVGGDEFGLLCPPGELSHIDLGRRVEAALRRPLTLPNGLTLQASASIGITIKNKAETPPDELFRQADVAVNRAKRLHSGVEVYSAASDTSTPHRMMLMGEIRRAIRGRELEMHFHPMIDCSTGRTARAEGLLRWRHPSLGLLQTGDLVDMMELSNLNSDLVQYCLAMAIEQCKAWQALGHPIPISINVGGGTVHDAELVSTVIQAVEASGLPPFSIGLELAEQHLLLGSGISQESTRRLSDAGVWLSLDHFGTGTSPLAALPHVSANALKLGRAVADDLSRGDGAMFQAISMVLHNLGLLLVVNDVDDATVAAWLTEHGADRIQGSAIAEPMEAAQLLAWHVAQLSNDHRQ